MRLSHKEKRSPSKPTDELLQEVVKAVMLSGGNTTDHGESDLSDKELKECLHRSLESMSRIKRGLLDIQLQQRRERHRLELFSETNQLNRSRVLSASLAETAVFIAAAVFQVIRLFVENMFCIMMTISLHYYIDFLCSPLVCFSCSCASCRSQAVRLD